MCDLKTLLRETITHLTFIADSQIDYQRIVKLEAALNSLKSPHWTDKHVVFNGEEFVAYDEAELEHGRYASHDEARDALVVYSVAIDSARGDK